MKHWKEIWWRRIFRIPLFPHPHFKLNLEPTVLRCGMKSVRLFGGFLQIPLFSSVSASALSLQYWGRGWINTRKISARHQTTPASNRSLSMCAIIFLGQTWSGGHASSSPSSSSRSALRLRQKVGDPLLLALLESASCCCP